MRYRRLFPQEMRTFTRQVDQGKFMRIGQIDTIDVDAGTCSVRWLDRPGIRTDVQITQSEARTWNMPTRGDVVLCAFDVREQARIVRYINLGQSVRRAGWELPRLKEGERMWETGGSYIYMKQNGDIELFTQTEGRLVLENLSQTFKSQTVNWRVQTDGGDLFFGQVKRPQPNPTGGNTIQSITNTLQQDLVELELRVNEFGPSATDLVVPQTPIISITLGTLVDANGNVVDKLDRTNYISTKDVAVRIALKSGVQIDIDKEGRISMKNAKFNMNEASVDVTDPDIARGLETNNAALGTRGQHAAREHDAVVIPLGSGYQDAAHITQAQKAASNISGLQQLALAIMSPAGPCSLNPALLPATLKLSGEITEGAKDVYLGGSGT